VTDAQALVVRTKHDLGRDDETRHADGVDSRRCDVGTTGLRVTDHLAVPLGALGLLAAA
jgi:hypothetical protein